ncbi:hypothetical protein B9Z19DRAFT_1068034 [Tuber borchii]|uniref:Uncharacterized protein n=1 Tax=Tuber borchii TaxID=42251 RepID=A0A2T6ZGQ1_TUBBO|nr:hypothetical protein B9Z19DRAFT_1068034 [Tuber borchii]
MGLSINGGFWLRLQFALHGHRVAMSWEESESCKEAWATTTKDNITIQLAVVGPEMSPSISTGTWYDTSLAPYPIMDFTAFKDNLYLVNKQLALRDDRKTNPIYFEVTESRENHHWDRIEISHSIEILHWPRFILKK